MREYTHGIGNGQCLTSRAGRCSWYADRFQRGNGELPQSFIGDSLRQRSNSIHNVGERLPLQCDECNPGCSLPQLTHRLGAGGGDVGRRDDIGE